VPIIIALTLIAKDAAHYNIQSNGSAVPSDVVKPGRAIDLRLVAETIDVDAETLRSLKSLSPAPYDSRRSFFRTASAAGNGAKIFRGDRGYSSGQVGQLAAPSRGNRRDADVHRPRSIA